MAVVLIQQLKNVQPYFCNLLGFSKWDQDRAGHFLFQGKYKQKAAAAMRPSTWKQSWRTFQQTSLYGSIVNTDHLTDHPATGRLRKQDQDYYGWISPIEMH